jgi:hypothetical protein
VHVQVEEEDKMSFLKHLGKNRKCQPGRYSYRGQDKYAGMSLQLRVEESGAGRHGYKRQHRACTSTNPPQHTLTTSCRDYPKPQRLNKIRGMYRVSADQAKADYERLVYTISTLAQTEKIDPVTTSKSRKRRTLQLTSTLRRCGWIWR